MTSEVALMNKTAVVLAADSAATVRVWENGRIVDRFHKGANKIFNISVTQPVGLMIYAAADFQGMPWEVLAKAYRDARKNTCLDKLEDYSKDMFDFIAKDDKAFPSSLRVQQFREFALDAALRIARAVAEDPAVQAEPTATNKVPLKKAALASLKQTVVGADYFSGIDDAFVQANAMPEVDEIVKTFSKTQRFDDVKDAVTAREVVEVAVVAVVKRQWTTMSDSGLVFAGYGNDEYFPNLVHFRCYGLLFDRLIFERGTPPAATIAHDNVSEIVPFAKSDMIKTFMYGASPDVMSHTEEYLGKALAVFGAELEKAGLLPPNTDVSLHAAPIHAAVVEISGTYMVESHTNPLKQVIGLFSVPELADLAETLVRIESLKERVTKPTESVSGPIDVAAISKSDGFVWINRKHYFDAKLNSRFFDRKRLA